MDDSDFKAAVGSGDVDSINYLVEAAKNAGIITGIHFHPHRIKPG